PARAHAMCCVLDGRDRKLLQWITDSQIAALIAHNYGGEGVPARPGPAGAGHPSLPLHNHCLFKLGLNLGEIWWLKDLALWLGERKRARSPRRPPPPRAPRGARASARASCCPRRRCACPAPSARPRHPSRRSRSIMDGAFTRLVAGALGASPFRVLDI